jgi:hypothetical protein
MAYKQKGCTPITAKIQKTTKGGVTNPLLKAIGVPMKKNPSMAKQVEGPKPAPAGDISMTPYSKEKALYTKSGSRGKIDGPKVSYDMAYEKAKKTKRYANMSKADYIKEAKRQTKSFEESGNWNANPKKPKAKVVSTIKSEGVKSSKPKVEKTAEIKITPKVAKTKKEVRVENRTNRKTARKENRANRKATREENKANRKAARNASPAKQTMQQQNLKKGNKRVKQKMGKAVVLPVKEKPTNTSKAPAGYSSRTRKDMAAKKAVTPNKLRKANSSRAASASTEQKGITSSRNKKSYFDRESRRARQEARENNG